MFFVKKIFQNIIFYSILILCFSCNNNTNSNSLSPQFTKQEKENLKNFFFHLMLKDSGIYVLHGSKPMCYSIIEKETSNSKLNTKQKSKKLLLKNIWFNYFHKLNIPYFIDQWNAVKDKINMTNYLIVFNENNKNFPCIYFININNTLSILLQYYDTFKNIYGLEFDPIKIIYEIEDPSSIFWNKILKNYISLGLLFGYGYENSIFFNYWSSGLNNINGKELNYFNHANFNCFENDLVISNRNISYINFPLPVFRHLENDSILEKYKQERKKIIKIYKGRPALKIIISKLQEKNDNNATPAFFKNFNKKTK